MVSTSFGDGWNKVEVPHLTLETLLAHLREEVVSIHEVRNQYDREFSEAVIDELLEIVSMMESFTHVDGASLRGILMARSDALFKDAGAVEDSDAHSMQLRVAKYVRRVVENTTSEGSPVFQPTSLVKAETGSAVSQELAAKLRMNNDPLGFGDDSLYPEVYEWYQDSEHWHEVLAGKVERLPFQSVTPVTAMAVRLVEEQKKDPENPYDLRALSWTVKIIEGWEKAALGREKAQFKEHLNNGGSRRSKTAASSVKQPAGVKVPFFAGLTERILHAEREAWEENREAWHVFYKAKDIMESAGDKPVFEVTEQLQQVSKDAQELYRKSPSRVQAGKDLAEMVKAYMGGKEA